MTTLRPRLSLSTTDDHHDVEAVIVAAGLRVASAAGRAPILSDLVTAADALGVTGAGGLSADERRQLIRGAGHDPRRAGAAAASLIP